MERNQEIVWTSLNMRRNYIETGDVTLSRNDAIKQGKQSKIRALTVEQEELVDRIGKLRNEVLLRWIYEKGK